MSVLFAGLPVADLGQALAWYERMLGRPPDMRPNDREACWQLAEAGWVYVVTDAERAGQGLVTLVVDDLDEWMSRLAERGIAGEIEDLAAVRKFAVTDPEGNTVTFGAPRDS